MKAMTIKIEFFSEWQCGSGLSSGSDVDVMAIRDKEGFPFVPGKTLKGLLRDAAETISNLEQDDHQWRRFITECFGNEAKDSQESSLGCLHVSNAELSAATRESIAELSDGNGSKGGSESSASARTATPSMLFRKRAATAIDHGSGQAKRHTLRRSEVAVPMTLYATISGCPEEFHENMRDAMAWIKRLGSQRHRGLGRCRISEVSS